MDDEDGHDVVVIGAGLAGLRAARDLAGAGCRVLVLEARDRVGGRGWTSTFPGTDLTIELGGSWYTPHQPEVAAEIARYGLPVRTFPPVTGTRWLLDGELRTDTPFAPDDADSLRAWAAVEADIELMANGEQPPRLTLSLDEYVREIGATAVVRDLLYGWWSITGGGEPARGCVEAVIGAAGVEGAIGDMGYLRHAPVTGWSALAEAMADTPGVDLRLASRVQRVVQSGEGVTVEAGGATCRARAAVVAVPVNVLPDLGFDPPVPPRTAEGFGTSSGRAIKVWMLARGVPVGSLAFGHGFGLHWLYGDREHEGGTLVVGFGWPVEGFDPADAGHVEQALRRFHPPAELLAHTTHDWIVDPASLGTWVNTPAGTPDVLRADRFPPFGRIAFATSDVAERDAGWFEGALVSGAAAAAATLPMVQLA